MSTRTAVSAEGRYGFALNPRPQLMTRYLLLCVALSAISIVLSWLAELSVPAGVIGVSSLYFAVFFYAVTTYWFGLWGLIATVLGTFIGSGILTGVPASFALPFSVSNLLEAAIPFVLLRAIGPGLSIHPLGTSLIRARNWLLYAIFGAAIPSLVSGLWGPWILRLAYPTTSGPYGPAVLDWAVGDAIILFVLVPPLCALLGGWLERSDFACRGLLS